MSKEGEPVEQLPIRKADRGDVDTMYSLIQKGVEEGSLLPRSKEELHGLAYSFFLWEEEGQVVGMAGLDIYTAKIAEVRSLYVEENFRGRGIATALVDRCLKKAKNAGIREVLSISDVAAEGVFRGAGFSDQIGQQKALFIRI